MLRKIDGMVISARFVLRRNPVLDTAEVFLLGAGKPKPADNASFFSGKVSFGKIFP